MREVFYLIQTNALVFSAVCAFGLVLTLMLFLITLQLKTSQRSYYMELEHRAVLSMMRESYEAQIAKLSMEMTATRERWTEVNHLLLDAQRRSLPAEQAKSAISITENLGISGSPPDIDPRLVFYLTPFSEAEYPTFKVVKAVCERSGFTCLRGDETNAPVNILAHVVSMILKARVLIANISSRNANVMYELGIAHSAGKPVILISQSATDIPFDVAVNRVIIYKDDVHLERSLSAALISVFSDNFTDKLSHENTK